ncbi:MAG TPA: deoxyribose-phosphate aldolase, partial [Verrucomicrobiae bacterium]|nr:deoxyribose-phosphate aldolase [Verrucomicrobiae bacterium]
CKEAKEHSFASVCVNPTHVNLAHKLLTGTLVKVCTVIGFPLGAATPEVKAFEAGDAMQNGAAELDMVINIGALKLGNHELVLQDIKGVVEQAAKQPGTIVKVIIETGLLTDSEKIKACQLAKDAGANFVKTSTGFAGSGATAEDVSLMRNTVGTDLGVKASGGIRSLADALAMVKAGANRLGTSSGVAIVRGHESEAHY